MESPLSDLNSVSQLFLLSSLLPMAYSTSFLNMVPVHYAALLAITLVFHSYTATANFTTPFLSPFFGDNACKENVCGKGNCVDSSSSTFGFECECEEGWKQARSQDDQFFKFLPCVVPNCTLNYTCAKAPAPPPDSQPKTNLSFFDPCFWTSCGGGSCNKTSLFTHTCDCEEGYYNLFNSTAFPCYKECAIGMDCASLGLNVGNSSNLSPHSSPGTSGDSTSYGDNACKENVCGKGNCVDSSNSTFGFECQCEDGWKQARSEDDEFFKFLPCVIPNCTLNYTCAKAPAPPPDSQKKTNLTFFDSCFWTSCGGGSCNKTSVFTHTCDCEEGYYNLFNSTAFPCYKECAIGLDCASLGLNIGNSSNLSPPSSPGSSDDSSTSYAAILIPGIEFGWLVTTLALVVLIYS